MFESLWGKLGLSQPSRDKKIHKFLEQTTEITIPLSLRGETQAYSATCAVLERIQTTYKKDLISSIKNGVGDRVDVAVALADRLLCTVENLGHHRNFDELSLILLANPAHAIEPLGIPMAEGDLRRWQDNLVKAFVGKYQREELPHERRWSSGAHIGVASLLLDIAGVK